MKTNFLKNKFKGICAVSLFSLLISCSAQNNSDSQFATMSKNGMDIVHSSAHGDKPGAVCVYEAKVPIDKSKNMTLENFQALNEVDTKIALFFNSPREPLTKNAIDCTQAVSAIKKATGIEVPREELCGKVAANASSGEASGDRGEETKLNLAGSSNPIFMDFGTVIGQQACTSRTAEQTKGMDNAAAGAAACAQGENSNNAGTSAASGASAGAAFGPFGALLGAGIGGLFGMLDSGNSVKKKCISSVKDMNSDTLSAQREQNGYIQQTCQDGLNKTYDLAKNQQEYQQGRETKMSDIFVGLLGDMNIGQLLQTGMGGSGLNLTSNTPNASNSQTIKEGHTTMNRSDYIKARNALAQLGKSTRGPACPTNTVSNGGR